MQGGAKFLLHFQIAILSLVFLLNMNVVNMFELPLKDGNITTEKVRKSRQMQFRDKTAYVLTILAIFLSWSRFLFLGLFASL